MFFKLLLFKKLLQKLSNFGFYLDHLWSTRVSNFTYGSFIRIAYDSSNPGHQYPSQNAFTYPRNLLAPEAEDFQYYLTQSELFVFFLQKLEYVI